MKKGKKFILSIILITSFTTSSDAIVEVHDSSLDALITQQIANDQARTSSLASLNWSLGQITSFYGQIGVTQKMYEDFLNAHGLGGSKLGRYLSSVFSKCVSDKTSKLDRFFKLPSVEICGTDIAADLANYLGEILNKKINAMLKSMFGKKPKKEKKPTETEAPGIETANTITERELTSNLNQKPTVKIVDENGNKKTINISKENAQPNGKKNYKDSTEYIINKSLVETTPDNTISSFVSKTTTGDKENLGDLDSPQIRAFYGKMAKQYMKIEKEHRQMFLRHSYVMKRVDDFFNTTFLKNKDKNKAEAYTIDVPIPIAKVVKSRPVGEGDNVGCLFTSEEKAKELGGCYNVVFGISFLPQRTIAEDPDDTLKEYTQGLKDVSKKIVKKITPNGTKAAKVMVEKFDIQEKIKKIKRSKNYEESGINFATLSELITAYADISSKLPNLKSPEGRDYVKINYLKAILYQLNILNEQIYLYHKIDSSINTDRYNEMYYHVLNIEKELIKIRRYETFYLNKILMK